MLKCDWVNTSIIPTTTNHCWRHLDIGLDWQFYINYFKIGKEKLDLSEKDIIRFWEKVDINNKEDCWEWKFSLRAGYGAFKLKGKLYSAHRIAYFLNYGDIPEALFVCHKCDNRKCCNPNHLWVGTYLDNIEDMIRKGRNSPLTGCDPDNWNYGEKSPTASTTNKTAWEIRDLYLNKIYSQKELSKKFNLSKFTIYRIVNNKAYNKR